MPNLGSILKEEIARLARRSLRGELESVKKASAQHRKHIAALKRQVSELEKKLASLARRPADAARAAAASERPIRFVAKGLRSQRTRLGLSAADFGRLVGVSAQTVYNWERESARPGREQLLRLVALRGLGKREALRRLEALGDGGTARGG